MAGSQGQSSTKLRYSYRLTGMSPGGWGCMGVCLFVCPSIYCESHHIQCCVAGASQPLSAELINRLRLRTCLCGHPTCLFGCVCFRDWERAFVYVVLLNFFHRSSDSFYSLPLVLLNPSTCAGPHMLLWLSSCFSVLEVALGYIITY